MPANHGAANHGGVLSTIVGGRAHDRRGEAAVGPVTVDAGSEVAIDDATRDVAGTGCPAPVAAAAAAGEPDVVGATFTDVGVLVAIGDAGMPVPAGPVGTGVLLGEGRGCTRWGRGG